jgi:hypothetical protein
MTLFEEHLLEGYKNNNNNRLTVITNNSPKPPVIQEIIATVPLLAHDHSHARTPTTIPPSGPDISGRHTQLEYNSVEPPQEQRRRSLLHIIHIL